MRKRVPERSRLNKLRCCIHFGALASRLMATRRPPEDSVAAHNDISLRHRLSAARCLEYATQKQVGIASSRHRSIDSTLVRR